MNWWCANRTATTPTTTLLKTAASASPWIGRVRLTARWNTFLPSIHLSNCNVLIPSRFSIADQQISLTLQRSFIDAFDDFSKDLLNACSYQPGAGSLPVSVIIIPSSWKKKQNCNQWIHLNGMDFSHVLFSSWIPSTERKTRLSPNSWLRASFWRNSHLLWIGIFKIHCDSNFLFFFSFAPDDFF